MSEEFTHNTPQQEARKAFAALVATSDDASIDLALAALLIAKEEYPNLNIPHYLGRLDYLAWQVWETLKLPKPAHSSALPEGIDTLTVLLAINRVLFEQEHFQGRHDDYYNPCNSYFNEVLELHKGIPITLSLLYMEVGKRLGLAIEGIGLPFHFVVGCRLDKGMIYIDPFEQGLICDEEECRQRVLLMLKGKGRFHRRWLEPVTHRQLLVRLLTNLKHIYLSKEDYKRTLSICDRILLLVPGDPIEHRDRGRIYLHLKYYARALRDLSKYVEHFPDAADTEEIRTQIKEIRQIIAMLN